MKPDLIPETEIRWFLETYEARGGRNVVGPTLRSRGLRMTPALAREVLELRAENERLREATTALVSAFTDNGRLDDYWAEIRKPCPTESEGECCPWHEDHARVRKFDAAVALLKETPDEA